jgi:hypothetical protein
MGIFLTNFMFGILNEKEEGNDERIDSLGLFSFGAKTSVGI